MEFLHPKIEDYSLTMSDPETDLLKRINRDTHAEVMMPRMLSGHMQGRVLSMLSKMIAPRYILEIGTYTGYSALCLAEGLRADGKLITMDINEELERRVRGYFDSSEYKGRIEYVIGNAMELIPSRKEEFDIVFIDADKENYLNYYNLVFDKVRKGGYIIADNVLWSGKVLEEKSKLDKDTRAIVEFNEAVKNDNRVEKVLFPVRDGLFVIRVK
jgi:caffeoyl-CoA O-methyltransferase